jgi:hypothetical protein
MGMRPASDQLTGGALLSVLGTVSNLIHIT